jgi:hypothetical protein
MSIGAPEWWMTIETVRRHMNGYNSSLPNNISIWCDSLEKTNQNIWITFNIEMIDLHSEPYRYNALIRPETEMDRAALAGTSQPS